MSLSPVAFPYTVFDAPSEQFLVYSILYFPLLWLTGGCCIFQRGKPRRLLIVLITIDTAAFPRIFVL